MRHDDQVRAELQAQFDDLTERISTTERTLALTVDHQQKLVLATLRDDLYAERQRLVEEILSLPPRQAGKAKERIHVEYDEMMRMIYEIRTDVTIMKRQFDDHLQRCTTDSAEFPPHVLTFLAVGGIVTLLLLAFLVVRIGMG